MLLQLAMRSAPTALSLSRTIAEHEDAYYRVFKTVEEKLNHAELTFKLAEEYSANHRRVAREVMLAESWRQTQPPGIAMFCSVDGMAE